MPPDQKVTDVHLRALNHALQLTMQGFSPRTALKFARKRYGRGCFH